MKAILQGVALEEKLARGLNRFASNLPLHHVGNLTQFECNLSAFRLLAASVQRKWQRVENISLRAASGVWPLRSGDGEGGVWAALTTIRISAARNLQLKCQRKKARHWLARRQATKRHGKDAPMDDVQYRRGIWNAHRNYPASLLIVRMEIALTFSRICSFDVTHNPKWPWSEPVPRHRAPRAWLPLARARPL